MKATMKWKFLANPPSCEKEAAMIRLDGDLREAKFQCITRFMEFTENARACPLLLVGAEKAGLKCASSSLRPRQAT